MKWYPSADFGFQAGHALLGAFLTVLPLALGLPWWATIAGLAADALYMGIKEFTFDLWVEGDTVDTGWRDIKFNLCGVAAGAALLLVSLLWR